MTRRQGIIATVIGVGLWFCAAMTVHTVPQIFDGGSGSAVVFALAVVTSFLTVLVCEKLGGASRPQLIAMLAWGTGLALVLDGLGVSFVPNLYAGVSDATQFGLAFIAWAAGLGLLFAFLRGRPTL